jgi:hypothetical protein
MNISGHTVAGSLRSMLSRTRPATGPGWPAAPRRPGFAHPYLVTAGWPRVPSCHGQSGIGRTCPLWCETLFEEGT